MYQQIDSTTKKKTIFGLFPPIIPCCYNNRCCTIYCNAKLSKAETKKNSSLFPQCFYRTQTEEVLKSVLHKNVEYR